MIQKAFGFLVVFILFPLCMGLLWKPGMGRPVGEGRKKYGIDQIYLAGFLTELALFQLVAVPVMIAKAHGMELLVILMNVIGGVLSIAGLVLTACFRLRSQESRSAALRGIGKDLLTGLSSLTWECRLFWKES